MYGRAVAGVLADIERSLGPEVVANRAVVGPGRVPLVRPWRSERARFQRTLAAMLASEPRATVVVTDVRECYPSIRPIGVSARLQAFGCEPGAVDQVTAWLLEFADRGVAGLPIGPEASAILANAVLAEGDQAAREAGIRFARWVDDIVLVARSRKQAIAGLDAVRRALARSGLELHDSKTEVIRDPLERLPVLACRRVSF